MNIFEFIFCGVPLGVVGLVCLMFLQQIAHIRGKAAAEQEKREQRARALQLKEDAAELRRQLHEAKLAEAYNKVVLQDSRIELEQLKIRQIKRNQGLLTEQTFEAKDYPPHS